MSNIYTNALRLVPTPGRSISQGEAEDVVARLLHDRGSYNVPVVVRRAEDGILLDIQSGCGKNGAFYRFWEERREDYACMWERFSNEGEERDRLILHRGEERVELGPCWYGFDEVRVAGDRDVLPELRALWEEVGGGVWCARVSGRYQANNDRTDIPRVGPNSRTVSWGSPLDPVARGTLGPGGLATPTSPAYYLWEALRIEPQALSALVEHGGPEGGSRPCAERVDLLYGGRVVHLSQWEADPVLGEWGWEERCADDWDNVVAPEFLMHMQSL